MRVGPTKMATFHGPTPWCIPTLTNLLATTKTLYFYLVSFLKTIIKIQFNRSVVNGCVWAIIYSVILPGQALQGDQKFGPFHTILEV